MNSVSFFPAHIKDALKNDPPGEWMPEIPDQCIRLSSGYPDPSLVPHEQLKAAAVKLLEEERDLPLHYLGSPSIDKLKEKIQTRLAERGVPTSDDEVLITSGACQAIDLIARITLDKEAAVAVEAPTYMEALEIFKNYTQDIFSIPVDENGLQTAILEERLAERENNGKKLPQFLYTIPTFQNPTGTTMPLERRKHLLKLASQYNFLIVEDDAYGELSFNKTPMPLKALDTEGRVLHVGSLSKIVAPGMRIGWIAGAADFIKTITWFKKDLDHPFAQATMAVYLEKANMKERVQNLKDVYRKKSASMVSALDEFMPETSSWVIPQGGYFAWVKVPGADTSQLLEKALSEGVSYIPGKFFFLNQQEGKEFLRLSFSYADEEEIIKGVQLLAKSLIEDQS